MRLGPIASGGRVDLNVDFSNSVTALKVSVGLWAPQNFTRMTTSKSLKAENSSLKQKIHKYQLVDEAVQPSRYDELGYGYTKPLIKVKDGRYEIPVSFEQEKLAKLPNTTKMLQIEACHCVKQRYVT